MHYSSLSKAIPFCLVSLPLCFHGFSLLIIFQNSLFLSSASSAISLCMFSSWQHLFMFLSVLITYNGTLLLNFTCSGCLFHSSSSLIRYHNTFPWLLLELTTVPCCLDSLPLTVFRTSPSFIRSTIGLSWFTASYEYVPQSTVVRLRFLRLSYYYHESRYYNDLPLCSASSVSLHMLIVLAPSLLVVQHTKNPMQWSFVWRRFFCLSFHSSHPPQSVFQCWAREYIYGICLACV